MLLIDRFVSSSHGSSINSNANVIITLTSIILIIVTAITACMHQVGGSGNYNEVLTTTAVYTITAMEFIQILVFLAGR